MEEWIGKTLDGIYRIEQVLGQGGMGAVLRARDINLNRDVAIKVMHTHLMGDEGFRARFLQEARAIATLDHPGIVRVYAFGEDQGLHYIVMDFIPGPTLHTWLKRLADEKKLVALAESLRIIQRVAWALHDAHEKGVLHRDIKPANIMLKPTSSAMREAGDLPFHPVLTDFGLAKLAEGGVQTHTGTTMGTPAYMSPEQCMGYEPDRRSDIYALGIVLYELTTGRVPFEARSLTEAIRMHTQEPPPPPRSVNPTLPVEVENVILRALAKRKEDRFATAREIADALKDVLPRVSEELTIAPARADSPAPGPYVSLMTRLAEEPTAPAAPDSELWHEAPPPSQLGATLVVVAADKQTRRISLGDRRTFTIGRTADNDLQLEESGVSRQHARIEYNGQSFTVTDLNSTNGTFLGSSRLLPGVSQPWPSGQPLRIGSHWLKYEVQTASMPAVSAHMAVPAAEQGPLVSLEPETWTVEAGQRGAARLIILNQSARVDHFSWAVDGIPPSWISGPREPLRLNPNKEGSVTLNLHPPHSPQSAAGAHPVTLRVTSQANPDQVAEAHATLQIPPFYEFDVRLAPQQVSSDLARLELSNQGNVPVSLAVSGTDPAEALIVQSKPARVTLLPGQEQTVPLEARSKKRRPLLGPAQRYPFQVSVSPGVGPALKRDGTRIVTPIIPGWVLPVVGVLLVLTLAGAGMGIKWYNDQLKATATAQTATVQAFVTATAQTFNTAQAADAALAKEQAANAIATAQSISAVATAEAIAAQTAAAQAAINATVAANTTATSQAFKATEQAMSAGATAIAIQATEQAASNAATVEAVGATATAQAISADATSQAISAAATAQAAAAAAAAQAASMTATAQAGATAQSVSIILTAQVRRVITPTPTPALIPFSQGGGQLAPVFKWRQGGSSANAYALGKGPIQIVAGSKTDQWSKVDTAPLILYAINGDFQVQIRLYYSSKQSAEFAGLGVRSSTDAYSWVRIGLVHGATAQERTVVVDIDDKGTSSKIASVNYAKDEIFVKITRSGQDLTFYASPDGQSWTTIKSYSLKMPELVEVYLTAFAWGNTGTSVWFEDYRVSLR